MVFVSMMISEWSIFLPRVAVKLVPLDWDPAVLANNFGVILLDTAAPEKSPRHIQILIEGAQWIPRQ